MTWPYDSSKTRRELVPHTYPYFAAQVLKDSLFPYLHRLEIFQEVLDRGYRLRSGAPPDKRTFEISMCEAVKVGRHLIRGPDPGTVALPERWQPEEEESIEE